jgi:protein-disulfide isomerase
MDSEESLHEGSRRGSVDVARRVASMATVKTVSALLFLTLASGGSTCRGQSSGSETTVKEPSPTPSTTADVTLPGIDTSALTPRERREWSGYVNEFLAPCSDVPVPVAQCVLERRACPRCAPAAKFLFKGVRDGMSRDQIEQAYKNRFNADRIKNVPIDGSPSRGSDSATITLVEFADFECPYCAVMAPRLDKLASERPDQVRMVFKFMPLPAHPHGEIAARAGIAAINQKKFWEMNKKMFENQKHLEQADLEGYAKDLGLDLSKFRADMTSAATTEHIARDRKLADSLGVKGTPAIYINGREFDPQQDLAEWISFEVATSDTKTPSAATPAASGGGSAKVAPPDGKK